MCIHCCRFHYSSLVKSMLQGSGRVLLHVGDNMALDGRPRRLDSEEGRRSSMCLAVIPSNSDLISHGPQSVGRNGQNTWLTSLSWQSTMRDYPRPCKRNHAALDSAVHAAAEGWRSFMLPENASRLPRQDP